MKQIIFRTLSSILFFGISFILLFLILASKFQTYNAALAFCILIAACFTIAYFLLRGIAQKKTKRTKRIPRKKQVCSPNPFACFRRGIHFMDDSGLFRRWKTILRPSENILYFPCSKRILLWSRHSSAVTADLLLPSIRKIKHLDINKTIICTLNGLADECAGLFTSAPDVFNGSRLLYQLKQKGVTIPHCKKAPLPPLRKRLSHFLLRKKPPKNVSVMQFFFPLLPFLHRLESIIGAALLF